MGMKCTLFNTPSKLAKGIIACVLGSLSTAANPLTLDWVSAGNNPVGYYYVSPYMARSKARAKSSRCIASISNHEVAPPLEWEANIQTFDLANVPSMQYGNFSSNINSTWVKYEAAAWLITQLTQTSNKYQQAVDQYAARRTKLPITSQWPLWVADSPPTSRRHTTMLLAPSPADMSPPDGKW